MEDLDTDLASQNFQSPIWQKTEELIISSCTDVVLIGGGLADKARAMEEKYPDKCWRYQDPQSQLLTRNFKGNGDSRTLKQDNKEKCDRHDKDSENIDGFIGVASFVVSPVEFYIQPSFVLNKISRLMLDMSNFYDDDMEPVPHEELYEGMPCAVRFQDDKQWYRAVVVKAGLNDARIVFVDWGNSQFESLSGIKPLTKEFGRLPPLTLRCRIEGARERTMIQKVIDQFQIEMEALQRVVLCAPTSTDELGSMNVRLFNRETKEDIGQKYIPKEPLCPHPIEYYKNQIRKFDLAEREQQQDVEINQSAEGDQTASGIIHKTLIDEVSSIDGYVNPSLDTAIEEHKVQEPIADCSQEVLSVEELDKKYEKFQRGLYSSDMEAFFDGVPIFSDSDSDDEDAKPKKKSLKQMKREAKLKSEGKWPPPDQKNQPSLSVVMQNRFYKMSDGTEFIKDFAKPIKPPKGDQEIIISRVISAREIYLHTDSQIQFLETLRNMFRKHLNSDAMPLPASKRTPGMACVYYDVTSDLWYRARIGEVSPSEISLDLIDKAKTTWIGQANFDSIKALPATENYFFLEPQIFKCKLRHLCEPSPVTVENDMLRQLLPVDQKFTCRFEREREPWRIKLFDPKTEESIIDKFNAEMEARHLKVRAEHQRTRLGDVALHHDTPYTRAKFAEIRVKNNSRPLPNRKSEVCSTKPNYFAPTLSQNFSQNDFSLHNQPRLNAISTHCKAPDRHVFATSNMEQEIVSAAFRMPPRMQPLAGRKPMSTDFSPKVDAPIRYANDIEAALNGDADVAGYGEIDDVLEVDSTLDSDDDEDENERRQTSVCVAPPLDAETERKVKEWIDDPSNQYDASLFSPSLPTSPQTHTGQNRTKNLAAPIANARLVQQNSLRNNAGFGGCGLDETQLRGPFSRPDMIDPSVNQTHFQQRSNFRRTVTNGIPVVDSDENKIRLPKSRGGVFLQ